MGIESTVVSITSGKITLLRPGMISLDDVERASAPAADAAHPAPGMHQRHYSPRTPLVLSNAPDPRGAYLWIHSSGASRHAPSTCPPRRSSMRRSSTASCTSSTAKLARDRRGAAAGHSRMGSGARPAAKGRREVNLIEEIDQTLTATPTLWWLGRAGFVVRFANITFYVDPCPRREPVSAAIKHADMILATHAHPGHLDAPTSSPCSKPPKARS